jgi:predicted Zn-dependent protease with MMP-like domain
MVLTLNKKTKGRKKILDRNQNADLPDLADMYALSYAVIDRLPKKYRNYTRNLLVRIENFPDTMTLKNLNIPDKYELLGLYRGVPVPFKSEKTIKAQPDFICLYRGPIIRYSRDTNENIPSLIKQVMIHEIGHHFGLDEEDVEF